MPMDPAVESDFSLRKMKIAGICLLGQLFGSSMLLVGPLSMLLRPTTEEFGWSRSQFSFANTAAMWAGALAMPLIGRLIDRRGIRPVILSGTTVLGFSAWPWLFREAAFRFSACCSHLWVFSALC